MDEGISMGLLIGLLSDMLPEVDPSVIESYVNAWLTAHPEATTTVQDGSITLAKLASDLAAKINSISSLSDEIDDVGSDVTDLKSALNLPQYTLKKLNWGTGGLGSNGEDYAARSTSIYTTSYQEVDGVIDLVCEDGSLAYVCFYTANRTNIRRNAVSGTTVKLSSLTGYSTAVYFRVELANTSIDDYDKLKIVYDLTNNFASVSGEIASVSGEIASVSGEIASVSGETYARGLVLTNGTIQNPYNNNCVTTDYIPCSDGDIIVIYPNRENTSGYHYLYGFAFYDSNYNRITNQQNSFSENYKEASCILNNAAYVRFCICEYDGSTYNPLRVATYGDDLPYAVVSSATDRKYALQRVVDVPSMGYLRAYPSSGSMMISGQHVTPCYECVPGTQIVISKTLGDRFYINFCAWNILALKTYDTTTQIIAPQTTGVIVVTVPEGAKSFGIYANTAEYSGYTYEDVIDSIEVKLLTAVDGIARQKADAATIEPADYNNASMWEIGGLGSSGEDYNRTYGIRMAVKVNNNNNNNIVFDVADGYSIRFAEYNANGVFLRRLSDLRGSVKMSTLNTTDMEYFRIEINKLDANGNIDTTPFTDTSAYVNLRILSSVTLLDPSLSLNGYAAESSAVGDAISGKADVQDLLSQSRYIYSSTDSGVSSSVCLTLLHFTDVHGNISGMRYALEKYNDYSEKIDAMLHTGDTVTANLSDGIANWILSGCATQVLNVIGNHDTEENLVLQAAGKDNVYNTIFAPYISGWNVTQPAGVDDSTSDHYHALYYYKDFTDPGVRLIVLDTNFWDSAQKTWLADLLNDALTNSLCVLLACHNVKLLTEMTDSNFGNYTGDGITETGNSYANQPVDWLDPVQDFIDGGGNFAGILAGHNHSGHMGTMTHYPDIFVYVADKCSYSRVSGTERKIGEKNQNTVSIVTINPVEKLFKIVKLGAEVDAKLRGRHVFCYDYGNKRIISQW